MAPVDPSEASMDYFRERFAFTLIMACGSFLLLFAALDWMAGLRFVAGSDLILFLVIVAAAIYMRRKNEVMGGIRACIAGLFIWFLATLPFSILIILWFPVFPLAAFFGLGRLEGMRWSWAFLVAVSLEFILCRSFGIEIATNFFLVSAAASLTLVILTVIFYQRLLEVFDQALQFQSRQLQQAQKMESIGLLASGVAHDFNNLLVGVMGNAELGMMSLDEDHPLYKQLSGIMASAERGSNLVRQLLAFAGKAVWQRQRLNINDTIEETRQLMAVAAGHKADLAFELTDGLPQVDVDPTQIQQMLVNLLVNAADAAHPERPCRITFRSGRKECSLDEFASYPIHFVRRAGTFVYVQIEDNGMGMDKSIHSRIFDPFFTTKNGGSGLGLAAVAGILRSLKGALSLESECGEGSTFTLWLPVASEHNSVDTEAAAAQATPVYRFRGTVLLVEDDMMARKVGVALLEKTGLKVLEAESGEQALELFDKYEEEIDLLVLDYAMPEMNGAAVFDEVRRKDPYMPVIISSGYADLGDIKRMVREGAVLVQKPFRVHELLAEVRKHLGAPESSAA
ncbi:MAG TPA: response regulator [Mariprofundaceae bacterium]|nr:response regulator [Mariprofundaceae bacterium]